MINNYEIRRLEDTDLPDALRLVWETFLEFEAPEYSPEGILEFKSFIELSAIRDMRAKSEIFLWGCFAGDKIAGVIGAKPPCHISLLFVNKDYHRKGIARALYNTVLDFYKARGEYSAITVNSSPYAREIYRRMGFAETGPEQVVNGIRFIPMKHTFR